MPTGHTIEILDNTWPSLQRAESIFGPRTESETYRGVPPNKTHEKAKPKRALA